jgi:hypothetical protein
MAYLFAVTGYPVRRGEVAGPEALAMIPATIYPFAAGSLVLLYLVLSRVRIPKIWLLVWGICPVIIVYALNPDFRVYSFHSFMHGGIIYQVLNGSVPPVDPVVAGYPVHYPWGPHVIAAGISRALSISPFYSLAVMNIISLGFTLILAYKISRLLVADERANILSAVGAVYASTLFIPELLKLLPEGVPTEIRGVPLIHKFITVNTLPVGTVFFLLGLYAGIRLFSGRRPQVSLMLLFISVLGTGFFYPAFIPGLAASVLLGVVIMVLCRLGGLKSASTWRIGGLLAVLIVGLVVLRPYLTVIGSGTVASLEILDWRHVGSNIVRFLLAAGPILALVLITLRALAGRCRPAGLVTLAVVAIATAATYFAIHLPLENEYKLLLLASTALGILGGLAFDVMLGRYRKSAVFIVLALFLLPTFRVVRLRAMRGSRIPSTYIERGITVTSAEAEENELYTWIRTNTDPASTFIDSELEIPVLGQRRLFIPLTERGRGQQKGYGMISVILRSQSGYDPAMLDARTEVARKIYRSPQALTDDDMKIFADLPGEPYVVTRTPDAAEGLSGDRFRHVYSSSGGTYGLYRLNLPE